MTPRRRIFRLVIVHCLTQNLSLKCCLDLIIFNIHRHGCRIFLDYSLRPSERCFSFWSWSPPRANVKNQNGRPAERKKEQRWEIWGLGGQTDVGLGDGGWKREARKPTAFVIELPHLLFDGTLVVGLSPGGTLIATISFTTTDSWLRQPTSLNQSLVSRCIWGLDKSGVGYMCVQLIIPF